MMLTPAILRDGDVLLTYGTGGLWPPRRWMLWLLYREIRLFQKKRWGDKSDYRPTHVRVWLNGRFFEATWPKAKWTPLEEVKADLKEWRLMRYRGDLVAQSMLTEAGVIVDTPYDLGDLLDFKMSSWLGLVGKVLRLFGDRANKFRVCSTAAAYVLQAGGLEEWRLPGDGWVVYLGPHEVDPAYFANAADFREIAKA